MIGEFQPKFDYRPRWKLSDPSVPTSAWVPDVDPTTGLQRVDRVALETYHQIFWPADKTVSAITAAGWFTLSKGWNDMINPVSGVIWFIGNNGDGSPRYLGNSGVTFTLKQDREFTTQLPTGCKKISVLLDPHEHAVGWAIEAQAQ